MEESQALQDQNIARIHALSDQLHTTQSMLYDSTKDYLDLKYEFRSCERDWMSERDQLLNELDSHREKVDISEGVDPTFGRVLHVYHDGESRFVSRMFWFVLYCWHEKARV